MIKLLKKSLYILTNHTDRVKTERKAQGITQKDLAARLQTRGVIIERDSISRIEIGTRFVADYEVVALCASLGVSADYLLGL